MEEADRQREGWEKVDTGKEREREREWRCLSQSGAFLPRLLIGSSVLSVYPRPFEEGLELTHTHTHILSAASVNGAFYGL